jgi:glycolate oxidase FAD binding subunit
MKNVAGYDVSRFLAGSWGRLGVITEVSLKVLPVAPAQATLVFELDQASALAQLHRWGGQPLPLNASCWVVDDTGATPRELLFVRLRGAVAAVESACQKMLHQVAGQRLDNATVAPDWQACRDLQLPFFARPTDPVGLWRLSVAQTAPVLALPWPQLVEWHGAQRWLWAPTSAAPALQEAATRAGGHATLFVPPKGGDANHSGSATDRQTLGQILATLSEPLARIQRRLKSEFDPAGIFNRDALRDRPSALSSTD